MKAEFEYGAQMAALEKIDIDPASVEEYTELANELAGREDLYREQSSPEAFRSAVADCLVLIGQRSLPALVSHLSQGYEPTGKFGEVRLNPKNKFFREIVLHIDEKRNDDETVRAAHFTPGRAIPISWIEAEFMDLSSATEGEGGVKRYDVLRVFDDKSGRLEFFAQHQEPDADERVTRISVWCW